MEFNNPTEKIIYLFEQSKKSYNSILKELGLSPTAYNEWKKGKAKPTIKAINKIADYFNVTTDFIFGRNTENPTYNKIFIENNKNDMTYWTIEKLNLTLENFTKAIDILNENKILNENLKPYISGTLTNLLKMQAMFSGLQNPIDLKEIDDIINKGYLGYLEYKNKHGISEKQIKKLMHENNKNPKSSAKN